MPTSMPRCRATSAAAGPTRAFARPSSTLRRRPDMSQGLLQLQAAQPVDAENVQDVSAPGVSRRTFLKFGMTVGAAMGGGLLLGFSVPAAARQPGRHGMPGVKI